MWTASRLKSVMKLLVGADGDCALDDNDPRAGRPGRDVLQVPGDLVADGPDGREVGVATRALRRADGDEDQASGFDHRREIGRELNPPFAAIALDQLR